MSQKTLERPRDLVELQRAHEQGRVARLAPAAAAHEAAELRFDRAAAPGGLVLKRAERAKVSLGLDNLQHPLRAERADELVLEVGVADEHGDRFEPAPLLRSMAAENRGFYTEVPEPEEAHR